MTSLIMLSEFKHKTVNTPNLAKWALRVGFAQIGFGLDPEVNNPFDQSDKSDSFDHFELSDHYDQFVPCIHTLYKYLEYPPLHFLGFPVTKCLYFQLHKT